MLLLDLFCGAGGCSVGYHRAGFDVIGVDYRPQPRYPFTFVQMDALEVEAAFDLRAFDAIHASPPCQAHSTMRALERERLFDIHPDLIGPTRELLERSALPYVIENVAGAPLRADYTLCGTMFGLGAHCSDGVWRKLKRHRLFECNWPAGSSPSCDHSGPLVGVYGIGGGGQQTRGYKAHPQEALDAIGAPWMNRHEVAQAIPPAYTEHIGRHLLAHLEARCVYCDRPTGDGHDEHADCVERSLERALD